MGGGWGLGGGDRRTMSRCQRCVPLGLPNRNSEGDRSTEVLFVGAQPTQAACETEALAWQTHRLLPPPWAPQESGARQVRLASPNDNW